jgi:hypothetical protein
VTSLKSRYISPVLVSALVVSVSGCVPTRVSEVPNLTGRMRRGAEPMPGATVTWLTLGFRSEGDPVRANGSAITDTRGEFAIPGKRAWGAGALLPAHALVRWRVELVSGEQTTVLWQGSLVVPGRRSTPGRIRIDCDLANENPCVLLDTDWPRLGSAGQRLPRRSESSRLKHRAAEQ